MASITDHETENAAKIGSSALPESPVRGRGEAKLVKSPSRRKTTGHGKRTRMQPTSLPPQDAEPLAVDESAGRIVERPDSLDLVVEARGQEFDPVETAVDAEADMAGRGEQRDEGIEALLNAEPDAELGAFPERDGDDPPEGAT